MEIKKIELESISIDKNKEEDYRDAYFIRDNKMQFTYTTDSSDYEKGSKLAITKIKKQTIIIFFTEYELENDKLVKSSMKKLEQIKDHRQIYSIVISAINQSDKTGDDFKKKIKTIPAITKIHKSNKDAYEAIKKLIELDLIDTKRTIVENHY